MFGYATRETPELMPVPIWLAHRLSERLAQVRKQGELDYLRPDGKTQVTGRLRRAGAAHHRDRRAVDAALAAVSTEQLRAEVEELVIRPVLDTVELARPSCRCSSTPPAASRSAGRRATPASRAARSSSTPYGGASRHGGGAVQRQGPVEGRPLRRVRDALGREERRRGRARRPPRAAGRLCDRQGRPRSGCTWSRSAPRTCPTSASSARSARCSTCGRRRSSATSTCCGPSTRRRRATATSAASSPTSPGSGSTASTTCRAAAGL
jgi:hypothetical protein